MVILHPHKGGFQICFGIAVPVCPMVSKHSLYPISDVPCTLLILHVANPRFLFLYHKQTKSVPACDSVRFFWSLVISNGEQLSISMSVLFDNFYALSFCSRFFSMTSLTLSIPFNYKHKGMGISYLIPYSFSSINRLYF